MHAQKSHRSLAHPFRGELRRHPHFFLVLFSFVFLGAMSAFLLVLSNVTMNQSQDIRQKASEGTDPANMNPPLCGTPLEPPLTGAAPLTVSLAGASFIGEGVSIKGYRWDFEGDGTWDTEVLAEPVTKTFNAPGSFEPRYQVQNTNEVFSAVCIYPFQVIVSGSSSTTVPGPDNLFFTVDNKLEFFKESNGESIKISDITSGERYTVKHTARIQNDVKRPDSTDARSVTVQFRANDSAIASKNFAMHQLHRSTGGIDLEFSAAFVGKTSNVFKTMLDTVGTVAETNENDNVLTTTYSYEVSTTTVSAETIASVCNQYCANAGECGFGLSCWYNKCRHPNNVESEMCAPASSVVPGCDISCSSSRDCAAGLACSGNKCRNPQSPSSESCQVSSATVITQKKGERTITSGQKGGTLGPVSPTAKPATSPGVLKTPTPTVVPATPEPTPEATVVPATPEPTVSSDVLGWFGQFPIFIQNFFSVQTQSGSGFPWLWLIVGGGILLLIILLMSLLGGRRKNRSLPEVPPPSTADPTLFSRGPVAAKTAGSSTGATVVATTARTVPNPVSPAGMNASAGSTAPAAILATGVRPQSPGTTTSAPSLIPQPTNPNQSSPALFAVPRPVAPQPNTATTQVAPVAQVMPARPTVAQGQPIAQPPSASPVISAPAPSTPAPTSRTLASSALVSPTPAHTSTSAPTSPTPAPQPLPTPARPLVASTTPLATPTPPSAQTPTQSQNSSMLSRLQARGVIKPSGSTAITNASTSGAIFPPAPTT